MQAAPRPDFVVAGAPKCGTTALFEYLSRHPSIFMPAIKEPNYFCSDLGTMGRRQSAGEYQALFAPALPGQITGEASAIYLFSGVAIPALMRHNPATKVVVMLRHPVAAARSLHAARWGLGHENIEDFETAWRAQAARLAGEQLPPGWPDRATLQYGPIYQYAAQVRRMSGHVPESQRYFMVFEDFFADPARHYAALLDFLAVPPHAPGEFHVANATLGPRVRAIDRMLRTPPRWLELLYAPLRPLFHALGFVPSTAIRDLNSRPQPKPNLRPDFRTELERYFAGDIAELESLLGRELWPVARNSRAAAAASTRNSGDALRR